MTFSWLEVSVKFRNSSRTPTKGGMTTFTFVANCQVITISLHFDDCGRMFWSVIVTGQGAGRALLIICGGGAATMLAFLGQVFNDPQSALAPIKQDLASALVLFVLGAVAATLVAGLTYMSQLFYSESTNIKAGQLLQRPWPGQDTPDQQENLDKKNWAHRVGLVFHVLTTCAWIVALGLFLWGCHQAGSAVNKALSHPATITSPQNNSTARPDQTTGTYGWMVDTNSSASPREDCV